MDRGAWWATVHQDVAKSHKESDITEQLTYISFPSEKWQCLKAEDCTLSSMHFCKASNSKSYIYQMLATYLCIDFLMDYHQTFFSFTWEAEQINREDSKCATLLRREP